jgi:hypothetical protein
LADMDREEWDREWAEFLASPARRREAVILLLAADSVMIGDHESAEAAVAWTRRLFDGVDTDPIWADGRHQGDCTKDAFTCSRCVLEDYEGALAKIDASDMNIPAFIRELEEGQSATPEE